jgi:transcriptional regulator with XRE-family HTH domain
MLEGQKIKKPYGVHAGKILREARTKMKLSQEQLGTILGYNCRGQYISNAERGKNNLAPKLVYPLSKILNIPAQELSEAIMLDLAACAHYEIEKGKEITYQQLASMPEQRSEHDNIIQTYQKADSRNEEPQERRSFYH